MNDRIDTLLKNIINTDEVPSKELSDKTKQLFLKINHNESALPVKKGIFKSNRLLISFSGTAVVLLFSMFIFIHITALPGVTAEKKSDKTSMKSKVKNSANHKSTSVSMSSKIKAPLYFDQDLFDGKAIPLVKNFGIKLLSDKDHSDDLYNPGEDINFSVSVSPLFSKIKFLSDPVIQICTTDGKIVNQYSVEGFKGTCLEENDRSESTVTLPSPEHPDWYYAVFEIKIYDNDGDNGVCTTSTYSKNFMVKYPENGTYTNSFNISETIRIDEYPITIESISMGTKKTYLKYTADPRINHIEIYITTDNGKSISPLDLTQDGTSIYAPIPKDTHKLILEIKHVSVVLSGTKAQGEYKELDGTWKTEINLN